jgi:hypothetical protein
MVRVVEEVAEDG